MQCAFHKFGCVDPVTWEVNGYHLCEKHYWRGYMLTIMRKVTDCSGPHGWRPYYCLDPSPWQENAIRAWEDYPDA